MENKENNTDENSVFRDEDESNATSELEITPNELDQTIMCINLHKNNLGVAYFETSSGELGWGQANENRFFETLELMKYQLQPQVIILSSKAEADLVEKCKEPLNEDEIKVKFVKSSEFTWRIAKQRLGFLDIPVSGWKIEHQTSENIEMTRAAGGLLYYLQQNSEEFGILGQDDIFEIIKELKPIKFDGIMHLDMNAFYSLRIFKEEKHPCRSMRIGVSKEGLSLFGILNKTKSVVGKDKLREWFLKPLLDIQNINERLDVIEFFSEQNQSETVAELREYLKYVKNLKNILNRIQQSKSSVNDYYNLYKSVFCFKLISETSFTLKEYKNLSILERLTNLFDDNLVGLVGMLSRVIDFKESKEQLRIVISTGIDQELDEYKKIYWGLDDFLTQIAHREMLRVSPSFPYQLSVAYFPQLGYLIAVPRTSSNEENPEIDGFEFHFMSDDHIYYKNDSMYDLDHSLGDLHGIIADKENSILREVDSLILTCRDSLNKLVESTAELDCLLALTVSSVENNYCRPQLVEDNVLKIEDGRHPLQEFCVNTFIPNPTNIYDESGRMTLITGPNSSGKSVYLKQIGLISFMAHLGCFVPASEAVVGLTDRISTRIQTRDSVAVNQSTFAIDVSQITSMVRTSSERSLLLIDEFGKGTLAKDGLALLGATVNHFLDEGERCPKVVLSTHYTELVQYGIVDIEHPQVNFGTMEVIVDDDVTDTEQDDTENLVFLYRLSPGKVTPSYGVYCASLAGVPWEILERAKKVAEKMKNRKPIERLENNQEQNKHDEYMNVIEKLMSLDIKKTNVRNFIQTL